MFDRAMTDITRGVNRSLLAAYDFGRFSTVVDIGGGRGALLTGVLEAHPGTCGASCSTGRRSSTALPTSSIQGSPSASRSSAGASSNRCPLGGDAYLLKAIIHDWEDPEALGILTACRRAARPGASVLVDRAGSSALRTRIPMRSSAT